MNPSKKLEEELTEIFLSQEEGQELGFVHRKVGRFVKRKVKRVAKVVKKVAPVAIAGAGLYFAAPYALAGAKFLGAKTMAGAAMVKGYLGGGAAMGPEQMGPPLPAQSMVSPQVLSFAGKMAMQEMKRRGVNVNTPQGQQAVQQYVNSRAYEAERAVGGGGMDMTKLLIPAAVGVAAVVMLKG